MIPCLDCGKVHTPGKKGAALGRCARCYKRIKRNLPPAPMRNSLGPTQQITVYLPPDLAGWTLERAGHEGASAYIRRLLEREKEMTE